MPIGKTASRVRGLRRLKRRASEATLPVETRQVMCIRGLSRRAWLVLPTEQLHGRACVALLSRMCWLHQLLGGSSGRKLYQQPVATFLRECVQAFRGGEGPPPEDGFEPRASLGSNSDGLEPSGGTPRKVGKAAILSGSEDECDDEESTDAPSRHRKVPKRRRPRLGELVTRQVRGFELTYTLGRGPKVLVPTDGPFIERIVKDLQPRSGEAPPASLVSSKNIARDSASSQDKGRVFWRDGGFQIRFQDADGKTRQSRAGLAMPRRSLTNEELTAEEVRETRDKLLLKARREWDRLDHSGSRRFLE